MPWRAGRRASSAGISASRAGSSPSTVFVPCVSVTGRSVLSRSVKHGTPSAVVSSWTPPESVTTAAAPACRDRNGVYGQRVRSSRTPGPVREPEVASRCARARVHREDDGQLGGRRARARASSRSSSSGVVDERAAGAASRGRSRRADAQLAPGGGARAPRRRSPSACRSSCCRRTRSGSRSMPSARGCRAAFSEWVSSSCERWSVSLRLCSSGIAQSNERRPASRWQTGICSLTAASAPASVELMSPGTTTRSGRSSWNTCSRPVSARAVCSPCRPSGPRAARAGAAAGSSAKKTSLDRRVVVLARVDQPLLDGPAPLELRVDGRDLHVVRARADDVDDELPCRH